MDFISAEEFLKQPEKVQKVFLDWYKPEIHDIVCFTDDTTINFSITDIGTGENQGLIYAGEIVGEEAIPLFVESQLRKIIEDKLPKKISNINYSIEGKKQILTIEYEIDDIEGYKIVPYVADCKNLLDGYWKIALQIAEEETKESE